MLPAFEWDPDKARRNFRKHRIHFAEAVTVFHDPWARFRDDPAHSGAEERGKIAELDDLSASPELRT